MESVMLADDDDLERFVETLEKLIEKGELTKFKAFETSVQELRSETRKASRKEEAQEAEDLIEKIR
jgi:hypothetical protein